MEGAGQLLRAVSADAVRARDPRHGIFCSHQQRIAQVSARADNTCSETSGARKNDR